MKDKSTITAEEIWFIRDHNIHMERLHVELKYLD